MSRFFSRESRLLIGSSKRSRRGAERIARANATRCCSPPESVVTSRSKQRRDFHHFAHMIEGEKAVRSRLADNRRPDWREH